MNQNVLHNKMLNCMANFNCIIDYLIEWYLEL